MAGLCACRPSTPRPRACKAWMPATTPIRREHRLQLVVNIIVLAAIYALIACGYVLIYRVSRVLNLAHGELMMFGSYLLADDRLDCSPAIRCCDRRGAACSASSSASSSIVFLMRKMTGEMVLAAVLTTIALGILLRGVDGAGLVGAAAISRRRRSASPIRRSRCPAARASRPFARSCSCRRRSWSTPRLFVFLRFGRWGVRMRAAGQNPLLAAQRGINLHAIYALAWGLSTFTGSLAGMLIALDSGLTGTMVMIGLKAFPAALVGGLDSLLGALIGALIIAAAEVLLIHYVDPLLSDVVPFLVLIVMLIVRPWGLFGTREELDRV